MKKCKRFMVFDYLWRNPSGGLDDCEVSFDKAYKAVEYAHKSVLDVVIVFDRVEGIVIYEKKLKPIDSRTERQKETI